MARFMKTTALAAVLATGFGAAHAAEPLGDVVVETRTAGVEGNAAYTFFPNITEDLETAIRARLNTTGLDTDSVIDVQVIELMIDGDTIAPDSEEFNEMKITVDYSHPENVFPSEIYPVTVSATEIDVIAPAGFQVVDAEAPDFYKVLISGTADSVVELLPEEIDAKKGY